MLFRDIIKRAFRSLRSSKARTLLTAFAVAVGAFALTLTLAASNGANNYADNIIKANFDPSELIVSKSADLFNATDTSKPQEYSESAVNLQSQTGSSIQIESLNDDDVAALRAVPGVASVQTVNTQAIQYVTRDGQREYNATVQAFNNDAKPDIIAGAVPAKLADDQIVLPDGFLSDLGFPSASAAIGKTIRLAARQQPDRSNILNSLLSGNTQSAISELNQQDETVEKSFTVVAVSKVSAALVQPGAALYLGVSQNAVNQFADITTRGTESFHTYISVNVKVKNGNDAVTLKTVQDRIKKLGYGAQSVADTQKTITQVISVLQGIVLVFGLIAVVASVFGVINTMYISVLQRTREIGLMKALGMHKRSISILFLSEAGLLGLLGGLIGSFIAVVIGTLLNPTISRLLDIGDARMLDFHASQIVVLLLILTLVAMIAGLLPARKAARLDPIEALRTE